MTMTRMRSLIVALSLLPCAAVAQVPLNQTLAFSARIADAGRPVTGTHGFTFSIWRVESGGDPTIGVDLLWTEAQTLTVNDGVVAAALGADATTPNAFPVGLFDGSDRWIEVAMDGVVFGPRMAVRAVPYAMRAAVADSLSAFATPQTRYVSVGAGACVYTPSVVSASIVRQPFYCSVTDGTTNLTVWLPVQFPSGATLQGMKIQAYASGTVTCTLYRGLNNFGSSIASAAKSGTGWASSAETLFSHVVDNTSAYTIACSGSGSALDNDVGAIIFRYTLASP